MFMELSIRGAAVYMGVGMNCNTASTSQYIFSFKYNLFNLQH